MSKFASNDEWQSSKNVLTWPEGVSPVATASDTNLVQSVLSLLDAAKRSEVQAELNAIIVKVNELVAVVNGMRQSSG